MVPPWVSDCLLLAIGLFGFVFSWWCRGLGAPHPDRHDRDDQGEQHDPGRDQEGAGEAGGQPRPCRSTMSWWAPDESTLTPAMPRQRSCAITASPKLGFDQRGSWPTRWRQEVERWQARHQVTVECCQRRWEVEWGLRLVGGQQRPTQEIANQVE